MSISDAGGNPLPPACEYCGQWMFRKEVQDRYNEKISAALAELHRHLNTKANPLSPQEEPQFRSGMVESTTSARQEPSILTRELSQERIRLAQDLSGSGSGAMAITETPVLGDNEMPRCESTLAAPKVVDSKEEQNGEHDLLEDAEEEALMMFITERERIAKEWAIDRGSPIIPTMLEGIDAEANKRIRMRLIATLRENGTAKSVDSLSPSEPTVKDEVELELSQAVRLELFLSHPCEGKYGDDGEMQCNARMPIDFKRDFPSEILAKSSLHRLMRAAAFNEAKIGSPSEGTESAKSAWNRLLYVLKLRWYQGDFTEADFHIPYAPPVAPPIEENLPRKRLEPSTMPAKR